jgi:hypothetical protein
MAKAKTTQAPQTPTQADIPPGGSLASQAAASPTPKTTTAKVEEFFFVKDEGCSPQYPTREHELLVGRDGEIRVFVFNWAQDRGELKVDRAAANKFLKHEGFTVRDSKGHKIERVPDQPDPHLAKKPFVLQVGHVIAKMDELTTDALLTRVHQELGGDQYDVSSGRARLIAFLIQKRKDRDAAMKPKKGQRDQGIPGSYVEDTSGEFEDYGAEPAFSDADMVPGAVA